MLKTTPPNEGVAHVDASKLRSAVQRSCQIANTSVRCSIPCLSWVSVTLEIDCIRLRACYAGHGRDIYFSERVEAFVSWPGEDITVAVSAKALKKALTGANGNLAISVAENGKLRVGKALLAVHDASEMPLPSDADTLPLWCFELDADDLHQSFGRTAECMSNEETRYYLNGVCVTAPEHSPSKALEFASIDGQRLARAMPGAVLTVYKVARGQRDLLRDYQAIVPRFAVNFITRYAKKAGGKCGFIATEKHGGLRWFEFKSSVKRKGDPQFVLRTQLVDGTFPDYARVIPHKAHTGLTFDRDAMLAVLEPMLGGAIKLTFEKESILIEARDGQDYEATDIVPASVNPALVERAAGYNSRYLVGMLKLTSGTVRMAWGSGIRDDTNPAGDPVLITCPDDGDFQFVLMPFRV